MVWCFIVINIRNSTSHGFLEILNFSCHASCNDSLDNYTGACRENVNPLRPNNDVSQTSHCNIKGVSVSEVMRIESMITQVQCY